MPNYSPAGGDAPSSARRIVLICGFLAASAAAFVYYHQDSALDQESTGTAQAVAAAGPASDGANGGEYPVARFNSEINSAVAEALSVPPPTEWSTVTVKSGQSLSNIFDEAHLPPEDWMQITDLGGDAGQLEHLKAGDQLRLRIVGGELLELIYPMDELRTLSVRRGDRVFEATTLTASLEHRSGEASGTIENSLFLDGRKSGLNDRMILEFADLFGYDIDFAQDLQEGDRFSVVYDQIYKDGKKLRDGDILAAEFSNNGHTYRAVRYVAADGTKAYYTPQGQSLRKAFIRTPVDFTRITSGFTLHRWHPILNRMRAHMGTDYAAPTGTPVHASGNGRVEFVGRKGGYGNVVVLKHGNQYETVYGHLSRFQRGLRVGAPVTQGQVIAYVGMTGLATGPHLHYEFRVNGMPVNPEKVILPRSMPLDPKTMARFRSTAAPLVAALDGIDNHGNLARASTADGNTATP